MTGSVAKNGWGRKKLGPDSSLGGALEEALHESHLSANVAFPESFNLSLPNHVHCLEPAEPKTTIDCGRNFICARTNFAGREFFWKSLDDVAGGYGSDDQVVYC